MTSPPPVNTKPAHDRRPHNCLRNANPPPGIEAAWWCKALHECALPELERSVHAPCMRSLQMPLHAAAPDQPQRPLEPLVKQFLTAVEAGPDLPRRRLPVPRRLPRRLSLTAPAGARHLSPRGRNVDRRLSGVQRHAAASSRCQIPVASANWQSLRPCVARGRVTMQSIAIGAQTDKLQPGNKPMSITAAMNILPYPVSRSMGVAQKGSHTLLLNNEVQPPELQTA